MSTSKLTLGSRETERPKLKIERWRWANWRAIGFTPHHGQIRAFNAYREHRFTFSCAGRRGGKSELGGHGLAFSEFTRPPETVKKPERWPKKVLVLAPFYKQARIIFGKAHRKAHEEGVPLVVDRFSENSMELETPWGSKIACFTARNVKAIPGFDWDVVIADELPLFASEEFLDEALFPALMDGMGRFFGIGTPDYPGSYCHGLMLKGLDPNNKRWGHTTWTTEENWHMPHFKEELAEIKKNTPWDIYQRAFLARFVPRAGLVYPEAAACIMSLREAQRVEPVVRKYGEHGRAIDWGYINPFVQLVVILHGDIIYVWDEYYQTQRTVTQHAEVLARRFDTRYKFIVNMSDQAEPGSIKEMNNFQYQHPTKGWQYLSGAWIIHQEKPGIFDRIDLLRRLMYMGLLKIHPRCKNLIKEFSLERYKERKPGDDTNIREEPIDAHNHGTSALGYYSDFKYGKTKFDEGLSDRDAPGSEAEEALAGYE